MKKEIIFDFLAITANVGSKEFISNKIPDKRCKGGFRVIKSSVGILSDVHITVKLVPDVTLFETYDIFNLGKFTVLVVNRLNDTIALRSSFMDLEVNNFRLSNKLLATLTQHIEKDNSR